MFLLSQTYKRIMQSEHLVPEMDGNGADERWVQANSDNGAKEEEEEEEEALSLCDLPINELDMQSRKEVAEAIESQEDFNFFSGGDSLCKEAEMCAADVVFFQGQFLPLRQSVSSEGGFIKLQSDSRNGSRCMSTSESMNHSWSGGFTCGSSRSNSINSLHSSSSGSSSATTTNTTIHKHKPRPIVGNQFQYSHPSPKPQIRPSTITNTNGNLGNSDRNSALWSLFRVGLMKTPQIAIQDLKNRTNNNNKISAANFGSRSRSNSINSSLSNNNSKTIVEKQKRRFFFEKTGVLFGNCKCSAKAIGTVPSRVAVIRRSASAKTADDEEKQHQNAMKKTKQQQAGKQALSRHGTFEWLKQLSLELQ